MNYGLFNSKETDELIQLFTKTFGDSEGVEEGKVIGTLVNTLVETTPEQDIAIFVAREEQKIVASILFTRLAFSEEQASFLMAPVAVSTEYQGQGIGQALIRHGIEAMRSQGVKLAFTYGDPNFYTRVGFNPTSEEQFKAPLTLSFPHGWMVQTLSSEMIQALESRPTCVEGFNHPALW